MPPWIDPGFSGTYDLPGGGSKASGMREVRNPIPKDPYLKDKPYVYNPFTSPDNTLVGMFNARIGNKPLRDPYIPVDSPYSFNGMNKDNPDISSLAAYLQQFASMFPEAMSKLGMGQDVKYARLANPRYLGQTVIGRDWADTVTEAPIQLRYVDEKDPISFTEDSTPEARLGALLHEATHRATQPQHEGVPAGPWHELASREAERRLYEYMSHAMSRKNNPRDVYGIGRGVWTRLLENNIRDTSLIKLPPDLLEAAGYEKSPYKPEDL